MHYKNGREVKLGDRVVGRDCGNNVVSGIVIQANAGTNSCNLGLVSFQYPSIWATAGDCLHVDDALPLEQQTPSAEPQAKEVPSAAAPEPEIKAPGDRYIPAARA